MNKEESINDILRLQQQFMLVSHQFRDQSWKTLDVPVAQLKSLFVIVNKGSINFRNLAQDLGVTPANMTHIIDRLVEEGLVNRKQNLDDRRIVLLQATDKGRDLLNSLIESATNQMTQILAYMSLEELSALAKGLSGLIRAVEKYTEKNAKEKEQMSED